jgi:hypothetical protein
VIGSLREAGLVELIQLHKQREVLSPEEKDQKRRLVHRLITHMQSISAD